MSPQSRARRTSYTGPSVDTLTPAELALVQTHRAKTATFAIIEAVNDRTRRATARYNTTYTAIVLTVLAVLFLDISTLFQPLYNGLQLSDIFTPIVILILIWVAAFIGLIRFPSVKEY